MFLIYKWAIYTIATLFFPRCSRRSPAWPVRKCLGSTGATDFDEIIGFQRPNKNQNGERPPAVRRNA